MIKADLINKISEEMNISKQEAEAGVNIFFQTIKEALQRGEEIELRGFGSFRFRDRGGRGQAETGKGGSGGGHPGCL